MADAGDSRAVAETGENNTSGAVEETGQDQNGQAVGEQGAQQAQQRPGGWAVIKTLLVRCFIIYMISSFFRRSSPPADPGKPGKPGTMQPSTNLFNKDMYMDMYVYVNEEEKFTQFNKKDTLFWLEEELQYGDWSGGINQDGLFYKEGKIPISEAVMNNGSLYIHVFIVKAGMSPDPDDKQNYQRQYTLYRAKRLNKFKKRRYHTTVNLLTGKTDVHPDLVRLPNETTIEVLSHWHPNLTINIIDDHTPWVPGSIPAPLDEYIQIDHSLNKYYPIVYFNEYWNLNSDYMPINSTTPVLNLSLTYQPLSLFRWQMYAAQGMRSRWYSFLGDDFMEESDEDQDSLKQALVETNPYLLGLTIAVSLVHSVFEFLAFKNDIQFWRNRKSLEGLSVRSVFFNVFQSLIVVLYVLDNETNFVVRISVIIGLGIEVWKIFKVINVKLDRENKWFGLIPRVMFEDKSTYTESNTKQYDMLAFKYLSWLLFPLLGCYGVYSIFYLEHKGWYSWVLGLMYGFLLTFGFIMMTPQLFINYKLKSVAHLPWRMLTYKALNTFIDDLFAFVIKMPTLYRLGCFRDDIIFLIFLYQRYIYRVDPKRVNEYGTSQEMFDQNGEVIPEGQEDQAALEGSSETSNNAENSNSKNKNTEDGDQQPQSKPKPKKAKKED